VRGYALAEALGDSGLYGNVEFRVPPPWIRDMTLPGSNKRWGEFLQFAGFFDTGQTWTVGLDRLREIVENSKGKKRRAKVRQTGRANLNSAGCGVRIFGPWKFEASMDIGWPLTEKHRSSNTIVYYRVAWNIF
jgi:hemolysin activation/secretion protein